MDRTINLSAIAKRDDKEMLYISREEYDSIMRRSINLLVERDNLHRELQQYKVSKLIQLAHKYLL
jgi:hypothetical protein